MATEKEGSKKKRLPTHENKFARFGWAGFPTFFFMFRASRFTPRFRNPSCGLGCGSLSLRTLSLTVQPSFSLRNSFPSGQNRERTGMMRAGLIYSYDLNTIMAGTASRREVRWMLFCFGVVLLTGPIRFSLCIGSR